MSRPDGKWYRPMGLLGASHGTEYVACVGRYVACGWNWIPPVVESHRGKVEKDGVLLELSSSHTLDGIWTPGGNPNNMRHDDSFCLPGDVIRRWIADSVTIVLQEGLLQHQRPHHSTEIPVVRAPHHPAVPPYQQTIEGMWETKTGRQRREEERQKYERERQK
ncbi:hypothetical protein BDZ91DRAFT_763579 [Kalaharituber pfeilii]|nr:hypothetical protein BDZ91DRAFT_763579 [Kalaharituber pfeilii]